MEERESILEALEAGDYQIRFEPVDCINEYTQKDGTKFYVFENSDPEKGTTNRGNCTICIQGEEEWHEFVYDMESGDWDGDEFCDDAEIIDALESLDEFIPYDEYDEDKQWEVYAEASHIALDSPYYKSDSHDLPEVINFKHTPLC